MLDVPLHLLVVKFTLDIDNSGVCCFVFIDNFPYILNSILYVQRARWLFVARDLVFASHLLDEHLQFVVIVLRQLIVMHIGQLCLVCAWDPSHTGGRTGLVEDLRRRVGVIRVERE